MYAIDEPPPWPAAHTDVHKPSTAHYTSFDSHFPAPSLHPKPLSRVLTSRSAVYPTTDSPNSVFSLSVSSDDHTSPLLSPYQSHGPLASVPRLSPLPLPRASPPPPVAPSPHAAPHRHTRHTHPPPVHTAPQQPPADSHIPQAVAAELHSCLSFDPQLLINQLTAQPSSPSELEPRKRKRIPGLTKQQRKDRLKQQHREIDARRRRREQSVVTRMHNVLHGGGEEEEEGGGVGGRRRKNGVGEGSESGEEEGEEDENGEVGEERKESECRVARRKAERVEKGLVLERAVEYMERMQGVLQQIAAHSTTQQRLLRQLAQSRSTCCTSASPSLGCLPSACYQRIQSHMNSQQLGSAAFLSASAAMMVVSLVNGCVVDVNDRLLQCTGWERHHLIARMIMAPYPQSPSALPRGTNDWKALWRQQSSRILVDGPDGGMVPCGYYEQPAASIALMGRLLLGEMRSVTATWRTVIRTGRVVDLECRTWVGGEVDVVEAAGGMVKRPAWLASVYDLRDILPAIDR